MSAPDVTLEPEWSTLLVACSTPAVGDRQARLQSCLEAPIRWAKLSSLAERHGLQPLLFQTLQSVEELVPAHEMNSLRQAYQTNLHKAMLLSRELIRIVGHLSELGVDVMPYKGLALAEALYGDIALRQAGDIDLLIHPEHLGRVQDAVAKLGYVPHSRLSDIEEQAQLKSGYECAFDSATGRNVLEAQWAMLPRFYSVDFDLKGLFERAMTVEVAGQPMKTPSHADLFLTLSVHAAKHVWGRLVWLCDIARLMRLPALDWNWILTEAKELGVTRILQVTMLAANQLLGVEIPAAALASLPADRAAPGLAQEIQTYIASEAAFNGESVSYFRLMMRLRERRADRVRFLSRLILTPGPGEWRLVRLPRTLFPLYRLVRISRLASRLVGG